MKKLQKYLMILGTTMLSIGISGSTKPTTEREN